LFFLVCATVIAVPEYASPGWSTSWLSVPELAGRPLAPCCWAQQPPWAALTLLTSGILMMGLVRREHHGIGLLGMESAVIMVLYVFDNDEKIISVAVVCNRRLPS